MATWKQLLGLLTNGLFALFFLFLLTFYATDLSLKLRAQRKHQKQEERKQLINKTCCCNTRFSEELSPDKLNNFLVDDAHGLIYCYVPKVGSTNLKKIMVMLKNGPPYGDPRTLDGEVHTSPKLTFLNRFPRHEIKAKLKHYTKFLFVRDPFVRLISAYRNKFEEYNEYFYNRHGRTILHLYGGHPYPPSTLKRALLSGMQVSFYNLIQYVLDPRTAGRSDDEHWSPMYNLCHPCHIQYDFIGHQENMDEDIEHLLEILKLKDDMKIPRSGRNITTKDSLAVWFKTMPLGTRMKLYNHYEIDYKLFGYRKPDELLT